MITFRCAGCEKTLSVDRSLVGRRVQCASCNSVHVVPDQPPEIVTIVPVETQVQAQAAAHRSAAMGQLLMALVTIIGGALICWRGCVLLDFD